jgi:hypothetical protein
MDPVFQCDTSPISLLEHGLEAEPGLVEKEGEGWRCGAIVSMHASCHSFGHPDRGPEHFSGMSDEIARHSKHSVQ